VRVCARSGSSHLPRLLLFVSAVALGQRQWLDEPLGTLYFAAAVAGVLTLLRLRYSRGNQTREINFDAPSDTLQTLKLSGGLS
jgi:hypothetical protein